ncbi:MAG: hypothetical protein ACI9N1_001218 [Flavobacteriales bacterium]|jgi:hypothetical protein
MIQKKIKYRVINDWSGIIGAIGFLSILFAGFALFNQDWITSILSLGILTKAVETIIDLENRTITQYSSVFIFCKTKRP